LFSADLGTSTRERAVGNGQALPFSTPLGDQAPFSSIDRFAESLVIPYVRGRIFGNRAFKLMIPDTEEEEEEEE